MYKIKNCSICGKFFRPNSSRAKTCSPKCFNERVKATKRKYYKRHAKEIYKRQLKYLPKRLARQKAMRLFKKLGIPTICQLCGGTYRCQVHHWDYNPFNNKIDNLIMVCLNCHAKLHLKPSA